MSSALAALGFEPIPGAEYWQWLRSIPGPDGSEYEAKIDLLVGPLGASRPKLKTNSLPRVRPKGGSPHLHARATDEAIGVDEDAIPLAIDGIRSDGAAHTATVYIPHPFTYLLMKLLAFDDRKSGEKVSRRSDGKTYGRHHAMDLYRTAAMMTEPEYERVKALASIHRGSQTLERAASIVATDFGSTTALGVLRLREHEQFSEDLQVEEFVELLREVFPQN